MTSPLPPLDSYLSIGFAWGLHAHLRDLENMMADNFARLTQVVSDVHDEEGPVGQVVAAVLQIVQDLLGRVTAIQATLDTNQATETAQQASAGSAADVLEAHKQYLADLVTSLQAVVNAPPTPTPAPTP